MKQFVMVVALFVFSNVLLAADYIYEKRDANRHVIHIVTIAPNIYEMKLVKSKDGAIGRETVSSMARRNHAEIAINGGYFEIGAQRDGIPSGTLVIADHVYAIQNQVQSLLVINPKKIFIEQADPHKYVPGNVSILSSIPLLIREGTIIPDIAEKTSEFYTAAHARTAIGIKSDESIVLVVAEHAYHRDITAISMGEVQSLVKEKGHLYMQKYKHQSPDELTFKELKNILREEYTDPFGVQGLTMVELAQLMKDLGCRYALNLDGGGSSTLWLGDKVVSHNITEAKEATGLQTERPVSDAIIFNKK